MGVVTERLLAACSRCELSIVAGRANRAGLENMLRLHEMHCPGGDRSGQVWMPFAVSETPTAEIDVSPAATGR